METVIQIDGVVNGLNGKNGLIREHFHQAKKTREKYKFIIMSQTRNRHRGKVCVEYIGYKIRLMDWDNFSASFKHIGDALVKSGVIKDDNPKIIVQFLPEQIKVSKRIEQKVIIKIKDI
jgi:Holliday junction resolvase RusA-like endonuclease